MSNPSSHSSIYTVGGTVQASGGVYLQRQADVELQRLCREGVFAYVLTARQMGKSSLMVATAEQLATESIHTVIVDLQKLGVQSSAEQWYLGFMTEVARRLRLRLNVSQWWQSYQQLGITQRLALFFEEVVLAQIAERVVVFVDEIDTTLSLPFTDDFFIAIRSFYEERSRDPAFQRLSFVLIGVATPGELIQNPKRAPFNIGQRVDVAGFQLDEALPLAQGLAVGEPQAVLAEILNWTGGQPFLTQKLCRLMAAGDRKVADIVRTQIFENWEAQDNPEHLKTIRDRLLRTDRQSEQQRGRLLGICQQVLEQGKVRVKDSPEEVEVQLSGLMVKKDNHLQMYNRIYAAVFNAEWVTAELAKLRSYGIALQAWLESGRTDESRLLRGQALAEVLEWAQNKRLDDVDRQFLDASQAIEKREMIERLETERKMMVTLEKANHQARRLIKLGTGVLISSVIVSLWTSWNSLSFGGRVDNITAKLQDEISSGILFELRSYVEVPLLAIKLNQNAANLGQLNLSDIRSLERHLFTQLLQFKSITNVMIGTEKGSFRATNRRGQLRLQKSDREDQGVAYDFEVDGRGDRGKLLDTFSFPSVQETKWYAAATITGKPTWSPIFQTADNQDLLLTASLPIYDKNTGKLLGVTSAGIALSKIDDLLKNFRISESGLVFVVEHDGKLVGSSASQQVYRRFQGKGNSVKLERINAADSQDPLMRATAQFLIRRYGDFTSVIADQRLNFIDNGNRNFIKVVPYRDELGLDWLVVVVVPEAGFMKVINDSNRAVLLLNIIVLLVSIGLGIYTFRKKIFKSGSDRTI